MVIRWINKKRANSTGFSLVEFSIVILISGILLTSGIRAYKIYEEKKQVYKTREAMDTVLDALNRYMANYERYPCPASLTLGPSSGWFGQMTDCTDTSQPIGTCNSNYCVSSRDVDHDGDPATPDLTLRVRIGAVPFRQLNEGIFDAGLEFDFYLNPYDIGSHDSIDAQRNRLLYAVTEIQATEDYVAGQGAIEIRDEFGRVLGENRDFILLSHGRDGVGAFSIEGVQSGGACVGPALQNENCDNDADFVDALRADTPGAGYYDDMSVYRSWSHYFLWDTAPDNVENVYNLNTGNVGVGLTDPSERLHVFEGNMVATGDVQTNNLCGVDTTVDPPVVHSCFSADLIGGDVANGDGMECPDGEGMVGIQDGAPLCEPMLELNYSQTCDPGFFIGGFVYDLTIPAVWALCRDPTL